MRLETTKVTYSYLKKKHKQKKGRFSIAFAEEELVKELIFQMIYVEELFL
jgi:hypothetical protein